QVDVARRINLVADDSMGGRDTPSRGLELTAQYVASEFKRLGLEPGGDSGGYVQRYPIRLVQTDVAAATVQFKQANGIEITMPLGKGASLLFGGPQSEQVSGKLVLVGGPLQEGKLAGEDLRESVLIWVADWSKGMPPSVGAILGVLNGGRAKFVVAVMNNDSLYQQFGGGNQGG